MLGSGSGENDRQDGRFHRSDKLRPELGRLKGNRRLFKSRVMWVRLADVVGLADILNCGSFPHHQAASFSGIKPSKAKGK